MPSFWLTILTDDFQVALHLEFLIAEFSIPAQCPEIWSSDERIGILVVGQSVHPGCMGFHHLENHGRHWRHGGHHSCIRPDHPRLEVQKCNADPPGTASDWLHYAHRIASEARYRDRHDKCLSCGFCQFRHIPVRC